MATEPAELQGPALWVWIRFYTDSVDDWRPVYDKDAGHPGLGPYWCSGYTGDGEQAIICAWVKPGLDVRTWWPEAVRVTQGAPTPLTFNDRFPKPDWWTDDD